VKKWDLIEVGVGSFPELVGERFIAEYQELPHVDFFGYTVDFDNQIFILGTKHINILERNIMKFETLEDVTKYFNQYRDNNKESNALRYSVAAKKACVEFLLGSWKSGSGISTSSCATAAGVTNQTLKQWRDQYEKGLYDNLDAVTQVSQKAKESHSLAVKELLKAKESLIRKHEQELVNIDIQISTIKHLEDRGYVISKAVA